MQVTSDKDSPGFLAAAMAFTDLRLRKSHRAFNRSLSSAWDYVPKLGDFNIIRVEDSAHRGSETLADGNPGMDQEAQMDRNWNGETHTRLVAGGKRRNTDIVEEDDLPDALAKQVPAAASKLYEGRHLKLAGEHF